MNKALLHPLKLGLLLWSATLLFVTAGDTAFAVESAAQAEPEKGPHRGRMLRRDGFAIELSIFETGVPPEFRVWVTNDAQPVAPEQVTLSVNLTRLGGVIDAIKFTPQSDFLRGDMEIYEPHSFMVTVNARYQNKDYRWQYDNFEGRTKIEAAVAEAMEINTEIASGATLSETIEVFGRIVATPSGQRHISARFDGEIILMPVGYGQAVKAGDLLARVESNESLKSYAIRSPIDGVVTAKAANVGEQSSGRVLLTITNTKTLMAELAVFPSDRARVRREAPTSLDVNGTPQRHLGSVESIDPQLQSNQATIVRVDIDNASSLYAPGQYASGTIEVDRFTVPLAVKRSGLQSFRDFTVVYAKVGEEYEVRMLELGRAAGEWVEVLGGLEAGTEYVTENSFVIKADIEKSGASHDH